MYSLPPAPQPPYPALGRLFSNSSTRFFIYFTESSGTTAVSNPGGAVRSGSYGL